MFELIKGIWEQKPTGNIMLNAKGLNTSHLKWETKQAMDLLSSILANMWLQVLAKAISQEKEKEIKCIQILPHNQCLYYSSAFKLPKTFYSKLQNK